MTSTHKEANGNKDKNNAQIVENTTRKQDNTQFKKMQKQNKTSQRQHTSKRAFFLKKNKEQTTNICGTQYNKKTKRGKNKTMTKTTNRKMMQNTNNK